MQPISNAIFEDILIMQSNYNTLTKAKVLSIQR